MLDSQLNQGLMAALEFTPEDLEANRQGRMSEAQIARMGKMAGLTRVVSLVVFVVVILIVAAIIAYLFVFSDKGQSLLNAFKQEPTTLYIVGGVLALVALLIFFSFLRTLARTNRMTSAKVNRVEGNAKLKATRTYEYGTAYTITIGKVRFPVPKKVFNAFAEDAPYRVFYIKSSPATIILSAEML